MKRRLILSVICLASLGAQLVSAQATPTGTDTAKPASNPELDELRTRIAEQQAQIKKLQQAVDEQQKALEHAVETAATAAAAVKTNDGTALTPASTAIATSDAQIVPAVNVKRDIVNMPRSMQGGEPKASPLSVSIGNSTFTPYGFIDFIAYGRSTNPGSGIGTGFAGIPYNNGITGHISEFNESMQNSRIGFRVETAYKGVKVLGNFEMDFLGNQPTSVFQTSNSDTFRMRLAFVDLQKGKFEFVAGQDWSMFSSGKKGLSPLPGDIFFSQAVDTNYISSLVWARQTQLRFIAHPSKNFTAGISLENPQQFIGGGVTLPSAYSTQLANQLNNGATSYSAPNVHPDIIGKVALDSSNGRAHLEAGVLVRTFKIDTSAGTPVIYTTHSTTAATGQVNGNFGLTKNVRLIASTFFGSGGGRYIGGTGPDLIVRADGSLSPVHSYAVTGGFEANATKNTLVYGYYSGSAFSKNVALDANGKTYIGYGFPGSGLSNNKTIQEFTFGIAPTFWKNPNYGAFGMNLQYSYLLRDPWYIPAAGPKSAHSNIYYIDIRYTLP